MIVLRNIVNVLASINEFVFMYFYFGAFAEKREKRRNLWILFIGLMYISFFLNLYVIHVIYIRSLMLFVTMFSFSLYFKCKLIKRLYLLVTSFAVFSAAEIITGMVSMAVMKMTIDEIRQSDAAYVINVITSQLIIMFSVKFVLMYMKKKNNELDKKTEVAIIFLMLPTVFSIFLMGRIVDAYSVERNVLAVALTMLMCATSVVSFYLTERQMKLREYEIEIKELENRYRLQVKNYENLRDRTRTANKNIHDVKNFAIAVSAYLEQGKIAEAKQRLKEYTESICAVTKHSCGNLTVDALLTAKQEELAQVCPDYHMSAVLSGLIDNYEIDFCILLGNAIDNAIEESRRIENPNDRYVEIRILPNAGGVSVFVRNRTKDLYKTHRKTAKDNDLFHGFGMENMKSICEKHNGDFHISEHDGFFDLSIFLPNQQEL